LGNPLDQSRIGSYLAPGLPIAIDGVHPPAVAAPALGDDTAGVLRDWLGLSDEEVESLSESRTVATGSAG
jgi:2-methylfumaryl-CoA isomerase